MLLVGDIHITARYKDKILQNIKNFIDSNPDEENIIFMGDYVYHFSYHRTSLLDLFSYFLELTSLGKNIYVLAGNHDWLGQHFVFSEASKLLEIIDFSKVGKGNLHIITKPIFHNIEGKNILFLPFFLQNNFDETYLNSKDLSIFNSLEQEIYHNSVQLLKSENQNEKVSGQLNILLLNLLQQHKNEKNLTIIHHYYIANTVYPGQRARFSYKDIALSEKFLEMSNIKLISGHLHQPFVYKNFLCTGSVWHTSPTEYNHYKVFVKRNDKVKVVFNHLNPYIILDEKVSDVFGEQDLNNFLNQILKNTKTNFSDGDFNTVFENEILPEISDCTLTFKTNKSYQEINEIISSDLQKNTKDIKLKIPTGNIQDLNDKLDISSKNLGTSINDWKELLKEHITNKYQEKSERYFEVLKELKLI